MGAIEVSTGFKAGSILKTIRLVKLQSLCCNQSNISVLAPKVSYKTNMKPRLHPTLGPCLGVMSPVRLYYEHGHTTVKQMANCLLYSKDIRLSQY